LLPSTGQGCVNALQDAAVLANCLYDLTSTSIGDVTQAFSDYQEQRFDHVKTQYEASQLNAKIIYGHVCQLFLYVQCVQCQHFSNILQKKQRNCDE
jgi:2-polyprenyl-6-methoxyphenol hydroxylase-like FAD-dependent oxidoreductase